jgi:hypothetical protein
MSVENQIPRNQEAKMPDPTVLTTQQLLREITMLRELIETRLDGMDKAIELLQTSTDRFPTIVNDEIKQLQELHEEKFHSIAIQFAERDTRGEQTSRDSKVAVDAALQAAKEAVGEQNKSSALAIAKSEAATTKQIDQIGFLINTTTMGINDKIEDIKTRISTSEGRSNGLGDSWGYIFGAGGLVLAIVSVFGLILKLMGH